MRKLLASVAFIIYAGLAMPALATENSTPAKPAVDGQAPELPHGIITNHLVADAPLPSDFVMGKKDAPVVMIEYASLSCPHCGHFANSILPELEKKYIDTGKVRYVLRQFPINEPAFKAAMLVNCLGEESVDKYYLFNKVLFDSQSKWAFDGNWQEALQTIAAVGGVDKTKFDSCINDKSREEAVLKAKKAALDELKVPHTPYFFIAGEAYNGDKSLEDISKFIDAKLSKK